MGLKNWWQTRKVTEVNQAPEKPRQEHRCECGGVWPTDEGYLDHNCPKRNGRSPRDPEFARRT